MTQKSGSLCVRLYHKKAKKSIDKTFFIFYSESMSKNLLITLMYADGLHGGVKYSAELGNYLTSLGYNVYLCGMITNDETKEFFAQNNIKMFNVSEFPTNIKFDLVWAHHWPILPFLIRRGLKYEYLINSCISHFLLVERPLWFHKNVDLCLTLTEQTKLLFLTKYNIPNKKIEILPNTAPDTFFDYKFKSNEKLTNIAIVSNHPPMELFQASEILKQRGFNVDIYGQKTKSIDITPSVLSKYDVVVTIGKTVQYSLAMGIPVYNYDHFGGTGYITLDNLNEEEAYNFSGRNHFTKKSAENIADEIINQFESVKKQQKQLKNITKSKYKLSTRINKIIKKVYSKKPVKKIKQTNKNRIFFDYCEMTINMNCYHNGKKRGVTIFDFKTILPKEPPIARLLRHIKTFKF